MLLGPKFRPQVALLVGVSAIAFGFGPCGEGGGGGGGGCGSCIGISGGTVWIKGGAAEHAFTITDSESGVIMEEPETSSPWFRVNDKCTNKEPPCTIGVKLEPYQAGLHGRFVAKAFGGGTNEVNIESK